ncbi:putative methyltransferase [Gluconacetobacter diazotrophicus PA1 5]|nr:methyltransferase [Gluconacetobacter diazotrophicus]ACI49855.1 putative methyltransferase [Gluconacetobacter diazotrophicus PA1 5]TWB10296.1 tRNA1(Val) A37 N6-methylase TrmN6 [Gluconacetobacter diazotrophicus]
MTVKPKDTMHEAMPDQPCAPDDANPDALSHGTLLNGRLRYRQFRHGYRTGLEPVLMAAYVPARPGARVLEGGCGAGAGLMCLAHRVPAISGVGLERDERTAALAQANFADNGFDRLAVVRTALPDLPGPPVFPPDGGGFDHAFANPPWHHNAASASPDARRDLARRVGSPDMIALWIRALGRQVRHRGTLTLALPAGLLDMAVAAMRAHGIGAISLFPFWPKAGRAARIMLIQGRVGARGEAVLMPGMTLHRDDGSFTPQAEAVLRDGAPIA